MLVPDGALDAVEALKWMWAVLPLTESTVAVMSSATFPGVPTPVHTSEAPTLA